MSYAGKIEKFSTLLRKYKYDVQPAIQHAQKELKIISQLSQLALTAKKDLYQLALKEYANFGSFLDASTPTQGGDETAQMDERIERLTCQLEHIQTYLEGVQYFIDATKKISGTNPIQKRHASSRRTRIIDLSTKELDWPILIDLDDTTLHGDRLHSVANLLKECNVLEKGYDNLYNLQMQFITDLGFQKKQTMMEAFSRLHSESISHEADLTKFKAIKLTLENMRDGLTPIESQLETLSKTLNELASTLQVRIMALDELPRSRPSISTFFYMSGGSGAGSGAGASEGKEADYS